MSWTLLGFWTKKLVSGLLLLPASPLIAMALGLWLLHRRRRTGVALVAVGLAVLVACSLPIVANTFAAGAERAYPPLGPDVPLPPNTAIVVLGGGLDQAATDYGGYNVNAATLVRLRSAARLARRTQLPILVTGGVPPPGPVSEAERMADALERDFAVPVRWTETESLDTRANARLSVPMLHAAGIRTAVLVTDVQHMHRARLLFEAAGLPVIPAPTDYYADSPVGVLSFVPTANALRRSAWSVHEWVGTLWDRIAG